MSTDRMEESGCSHIKLIDFIFIDEAALVKEWDGTFKHFWYVFYIANNGIHDLQSLNSTQLKISDFIEVSLIV